MNVEQQIESHSGKHVKNPEFTKSKARASIPPPDHSVDIHVLEETSAYYTRGQ
jgi:hypothetical protein